MHNYKFIIFFLLLVTCTSCSDDFIELASGGSFFLNNDKNVKYTTYGITNFGQYHNIGGYSRGGGFGRYMSLNFRGIPEGEIFAIWETYKEDLNDNVFSGSEKYYYAYKLYPDYNISKSFGHQYYTILYVYLMDIYFILNNI